MSGGYVCTGMNDVGLVDFSGLSGCMSFEC